MPLLPLFALRLLSTLRPALRDYGGQGVFLAATLEVGRSMSCRGKALRRPVDVRCFSLPLTLNFQPSTDLKSLERPSACHASIPAGFNAKEHEQTILHPPDSGCRLPHHLRRLQNQPPLRPTRTNNKKIHLCHRAWRLGRRLGLETRGRLLTAGGYQVYRPTLTGQGEHSNLASTNIDLDTHIQDIVNVILWEDLHDVVLVGHSYGGMVITGVADRVPDRIRHLVYLDALLPENGESVNTIPPAQD